MMIKKNDTTGDRLTGAQFEPKRTQRRKPAGEFRERLADRYRGRQVGATEKYGVDFKGDNEVLPAKGLVDTERDQRKADVEYAFDEPLDNARNVHDDHEIKKEQAERDIRKKLPKREKIEQRLAELGRRTGVGRAGLAVASLICFVANLGVDQGAAAIIPVTPLFQWLIVLGLGASTVWVAHQAAQHLAELIELHPRRNEQPLLYRKERTGLLITTVVPIAAMIAFTIMRGENFGYIADLTGGAAEGLNVGVINIGLLALAILTFVIAVFVGFRYERLRPVREALEELAEVDAEIQELQDVADHAERQMQLALNTIAYLEQRRERTLEATDARAEQRHARLEHARRKAATRLAVKDRRASRGRRGPEPPGGLPRGPKPTPPSPMPGRVVPIEVQDGADERMSAQDGRR